MIATSLALRATRVVGRRSFSNSVYKYGAMADEPATLGYALTGLFPFFFIPYLAITGLGWYQDTQRKSWFTVYVVNPTPGSTESHKENYPETNPDLYQ